ncbi:MAG: repeat protein [Gemmataceae bacterium]|nr:repeat protein [Gemmataceae bacterium]
MRRARPAALLLAGLIVAAGLTGCGRKVKSDADSEQAVAQAPGPAPTPPPATPRPTPSPTPPSSEPPPGVPSWPRPGSSQPVPVPPATVAGLPSTPSPVPAVPPSLSPQAPAPLTPAPPPDPTPPSPQPNPMPKDPTKGPEWPTAVNGKPMSEFIREAGDADPAIREMALRALPGFGPTAQKAAGKLILWHMDGSNEKDPGVRAAAFEAAGVLGFDTDTDTREAIRILFTAADKGVVGGSTRLHAIQTLAKFGAKAETAIGYLVGENMTRDPAYETRRSIANTLGWIGIHEHAGPSPRVLHCLTTVLIQDKSAAVRLEAYQSLVMLGPPYLPREAGAPLLKNIKNPAQIPKVDDKLVATYVAAIKRRLGPYKAEPGDKEKESPTGLVERDRQVEIFARLALMRLDPKEINDENMTGIAKYIVGRDTGPKLMALSALGFMGEGAARKLDDVCRGMLDDDATVASAAVSTLVAMGQAAKPAVPLIEKLPKEREGKEDEKKYFPSKEKEKEYWAKLSADAIKAIKEAKPRQ